MKYFCLGLPPTPSLDIPTAVHSDLCPFHPQTFVHMDILCILPVQVLSMKLSWTPSWEPTQPILSVRMLCYVLLCVYAKALPLWHILCDPMDCRLPGSSLHGILQARILEGVAIPSSRGSSWPRGWTHISCDSCFAGRLFTAEPPGEPRAYILLSAKL